MSNSGKQGIDKLVGESIRNVRLEKEVSIAAISKMTGVDERHWVLIESGLVPTEPHHFSKLSQALGVPMEGFFPSDVNDGQNEESLDELRVETKKLIDGLKTTNQLRSALVLLELISQTG